MAQHSDLDSFDFKHVSREPATVEAIDDDEWESGDFMARRMDALLGGQETTQTRSAKEQWEVENRRALQAVSVGGAFPGRGSGAGGKGARVGRDGKGRGKGGKGWWCKKKKKNSKDALPILPDATKPIGVI